MSSKSNPFDAFKASKKSNVTSTSNGSSWLSTKKRGRDDAEIERDRQAVLEERKKNRSASRIRSSTGTVSSVLGNINNVDKKGSSSVDNKKNKKQSVQHKSSKVTKKRSTNKLRYVKKDSDDDEDDDDSFIVNDSEDEMEEFNEESESEEEYEIPQDDFDDDDESDDSLDIDVDDDDDDDDDLESIEDVDSSPEKLPRRGQGRGSTARLNSKRNATTNRTSKLNPPPQSTKDRDEQSDSDLEIVNFIAGKEQSKKQNDQTKTSKAKMKHVELMTSDDDDDILTSNPFVFSGKAAMNKNESSKGSTNSRFFAAKNSHESDDGILSPLFSKKTQKKKTKSLQSINDEEDKEDDTSIQKDIRKKNEKREQKKSLVLFDTDSEGDANIDGDGFDADEQDEVIALSLALEASKRDMNTSKLSFEKKKTKSTIIYKDDLEDSEDEANESEVDEGAEEDTYEALDEDELQASYVLDAANKLSAHIVSVLKTWCLSDDNMKTSADAMKGLIVDGALSLGAIKSGKSSKTEEEEEEKKSEEKDSNDMSKSHKWISKELMSKVCPDIVLKDYQLIGVNWMALLHSLTFEVQKESKSRREKKDDKGGRNVNGVLADEMGLGKTVQTIAFLAWLKYCSKQGFTTADDDKYNKPHIIIVPASVLSNWEREFNRFCPHMNVVRYHGSMSERAEIKDRLREYLPKKKGTNKGRTDLDVVLTTFSYFSSEKQDDRHFLRKFEWNYMVVDEAHCLKNPKGSRYRNMDKFSTQRRLLLTGTPVQNSAQELMSLLCFLMPLFTKEVSGFDDEDGNDGGARMLEHFVRIELLKDDKKAANMHITQEQAYAKLKQLFAPFVLRRSKDDVLPQWLPPKKKQIEWVPFDQQTRDVYDSILHRHIANKENSLAAQSHVFTDLRKAANHPLLLRTRHISDEEVNHLSKHLFMYGYFGQHETCTLELVKKELKSFSDYDIHCAAQTLIEENKFRSAELERYTLQESDLFCSPKFSRLKTLLPQLIGKGHRILIFSQWTRCLDLLGCLMDALCISCLRLDGQTTINERQTLIDQFTHDTSIPVFLLSTRAGGMGINLTAADTCILHDLDFNPFNDLQAEDRCHRIGQTKAVTIYKMITKDTVDSDIHQMQERKSQMNQAILDSNSKAKNSQDSAEVSHILEMAVSRYHHAK